MKKLVSLILVLLMVLATVPAMADKGDLPLFDEKVTLTIGVTQSANVEDFNTNWMTGWIEELANVDIEFQVYSSEMNTQLTMAITAGSDLPDILFTNGVSTDLMFQWALAGAIIPLNDLYEEYGYYVYDAVERSGADFLAMMTSPDGNIYTMPGYNQSLTNECPDRIWINKPWLEKLGLSEPTNLDELYTVLKAFKEQDPNGNGEADEIPMMGYADLTGWWRAIMNMFQYTPANGLSVTDGVVSYASTTDAYREGLKFIRKLFDEGLIDPMTLTADQEQLRALINGETCMVGLTVNYDAETTYYSEVDNDWALIKPFTNAEGQFVTTYSPSVPSVNGMITSSCEDPVAAFRLIDLLYREDMGIVNHWGQEGVHWEWAQEGDESKYSDLGFEPVFRELEGLWGNVQNIMWYQRGPWVRQKEIAAGRVVVIDEAEKIRAEKKQDINLADYVNSYPSMDTIVPMLSFTAEETDLISIARTDLETYMATARTNFMMNREGMDIYDDASWEAYLKQLDVIGIDLVLETIQASYDRMYK